MQALLTLPRKAAQMSFDNNGNLAGVYNYTRAPR
jgi:hypothetical protein